MKLPISKRLLCCADLVPPCDTVADVGTDHGYLGIHLLRTERCRQVIAADLREKPLASARANAELFGIAELPTAFPLGGRCRPASLASRTADEETSDDGPAPSGMSFLLSDGLHNFEPGSFDVLVCAGMGGDLITRILAEAPWLDGGAYTLILQPQSAAHELRRALGEWGWSIETERLVRDGGFLYAVLSVRPGQGSALTPGEQYISPALRAAGDPLYEACLARTRRALELTVAGISQSTDPSDLERAKYFREALAEIRQL